MRTLSRSTSLPALLICFLASGSFLACGKEDAPAAVKAPPVAVVEAMSQDLEDRIQASGELVARNQTTLAAELSGRVSRIHVEEGDSIELERTLVEIDPERRQLELASAKAQAAQARAELSKERREVKRMRTLNQNNVASRSKLDNAETALAMAAAGSESAQAQVRVAERAVRDASVTAPFAGLLARRYVNIGEFVQAGTPLVELVSLDPLDVLFRVAELDSGRVHVGQEVSVQVAPFPDEEFTAIVDVVSPTIDSETRTLRVRATLPNPEGRLRPGLFARAGLGVATRSAIVVLPEEAVLQRSEGPVVFVLTSDGHVERRQVRTGGFYPEGREIVSGVAAGERIVVRGHSELVDGAVVRIAEEPTRSPTVASGPNSKTGIASAAEATAEGAL